MLPSLACILKYFSRIVIPSLHENYIQNIAFWSQLVKTNYDDVQIECESIVLNWLKFLFYPANNQTIVAHSLVTVILLFSKC